MANSHSILEVNFDLQKVTQDLSYMIVANSHSILEVKSNSSLCKFPSDDLLKKVDFEIKSRMKN